MYKATNYSLSQCNDTFRILYTNMHDIITFFEDKRMTINALITVTYLTDDWLTITSFETTFN
jgi:hypothetical protein